MGMFDDIKYEGRDFQTKDFDCELATYSIEGGRLLKKQWRQECGKVIEAAPHDMNFHGWLNFYTCNIDPANGSRGKWEEYNAKFVDGALMEVVPVA